MAERKQSDRPRGFRREWTPPDKARWERYVANWQGSPELAAQLAEEKRQAEQEAEQPA